MREIKFRGKSTTTGEWVYGSLVISGINGNWVIFEPSGMSYKVEPETVGQYTDLESRDGEKIYEYDVIKFSLDQAEIKGVVVFMDGCFKVLTDKYYPMPLFIVKNIEVIGTIYDNHS